MKNLGFEFTAGFPDDAITEGEEEGEVFLVVRPSGMAIAHAIVELLKGVGLPVSEPEMDLEHESWVFTAEMDGKRHSTQIYDFGDDERFLFVWGASPWLKRLFNRRDFYLDYLQTLYGLLRSDPRFGSVEWVDNNRHPVSPERL